MSKDKLRIVTLDTFDKIRNKADKSILSFDDKNTRIKFGKYEGKDLLWRVLRVWKHERKALLISENVITERTYHGDAKEYKDLEDYFHWDSAEPITWEECSLREWLNQDLYGKLLEMTDEEKARVMATHLKNEDNPEYGTPGGNPTWDRFFLLSLREAKLYFDDDDDRVCYDKDGQETVWWWLRSPGLVDGLAASVLNLGIVDQGGYRVSDGDVGVRPAFYLNLRS